MSNSWSAPGSAPGPAPESESAPVERCHCGCPLHYLSKTVETMVRRLIAQKGEMVIIADGDGRKWLVSRHYVALHGLKERELPKLGFQEITGRYWVNGDAITCMKCGRTSHNLNDVQQRYCGFCKEFMCQ